MKRLFASLFLILALSTSAFAAKAIPDATLDLTLDKLATATHMVLCSTQPANYAGIAAVTLATVSMSSGDFTKADDTSGRKVTVAAKSNITPSANGTATYVCLDDGSALLGCTTATSQAVTTSQQWNFPSWKVNIQDPT